MPSSCRLSEPVSSRESSEGRSAAAKPTRIKNRTCGFPCIRLARSRRPGKVSGIARNAARNGSTTSAVFFRSGRRCARRIPAKVAETSGEAVGGG
jgi:hypothetical protein